MPANGGVKVNKISSISELEQLYDDAVQTALDKVRAHLTPRYREWISACRFVVVSTVGPHGTDASPRGDIGAVVKVLDEHTLLLPDWRGNNRLDSLRNIVEDGRISLLFIVAGSNNVVRINGKAELTADKDYTSRFEDHKKQPRSVIVIHIAEVYFQCAKALMRSQLWEADVHETQLPSAGDFIKEFNSDFDAESYDSGYEEYARERMW